MTTKLIGPVVATSVVVTVFCAALPARAITVELANKCRDLAIKAHPPSPPGTSPYAQAERDFYRECISKNGVMPSTTTNGSSPDNPPAKSK